jgi:hypothetical protein
MHVHLLVTPNGLAIKRTEREVPKCYVGIARSRVAERACYPTQAPGRVPVL